MNQTLQIVPTEDKVESGVRDVKAIADALADILADTYRLIFKTHAYHWNVTGPAFYSIHKLTEEHYENMFSAADELAERIRSLGQLAPMRLANIMSRSQVEDLEEIPSAAEMMHDLAKDHEALAKRLHSVIEIAGKNSDPVTEDLATERSAFHEEAAWMVKAINAS
ncbi:MAG: DNA starvation/stationary phase protection protein [Pseudomonadota bacterium]